MKTLKIISFTLIILMLSVITFYSFNLIFSVVSNYQSLSRTSFSGFPMYLLCASLITLLIVAYKYIYRNRRDMFFFRQYSIGIIVLSSLGVLMSIFVGTYVYGSFTKDFIFKCYPLILLIIHLLLLACSTYMLVYSQGEINKNHLEPETKLTLAFALRNASLTLIIIYALNRLGAFVLIPYYYSEVDGAYTIPYLIQLLIPSLIMITYLLHDDFFRNRKLTLTLSCIALGYTIFSLIYTCCMAHGNYPLMINPLSFIQQFERLVRYPIDAVLLYGISILIPFLNALNNSVMIIKERKRS